jgi:hypothetical protein
MAAVGYAILAGFAGMYWIRRKTRRAEGERWKGAAAQD